MIKAHITHKNLHIRVFEVIVDNLVCVAKFSFPFLALRSFLVGITRTKALNMAALTAVLVNIPGNWLLIFHWNMGIAGAAIASSFAEACSLAVRLASKCAER